jgi:hypothetical protein
VEPRTFSYTPASAHRAGLALWKRTLFPSVLFLIAITVFSWQRSAHKPLFVRLLRLTTPVITTATIGLITFYVGRGAFSSARYICTPDALTHAAQWNEYTIERTQVSSLEVTPTSLSLRPTRGNPIRISRELDEYPELLDILRGWNPPKIVYRDVEWRRLVLTYLFCILGIALLYYLIPHPPPPHLPR